MMGQTGRRVVVTGLGVVSPIGVGKDNFWNAINEGLTNFSEVESIDTSLYRTKRAALVSEEQIGQIAGYSESNRHKRLDKCSRYAVVAAKLAVEDSGMELHTVRDAGCIIATTSGGWVSGEKYYRNYLNNKENRKSLRLLVDSPYYRPTYCVAKELKLRGYSSTITAACASGNMGIAHAMDLIRHGEYDIMLAGGSDAVAEVPFALFNALRLVSNSVCKPFDKNRPGLILAEGAAMLVLESLEHALARNAKIYAEINGYGLSCDANHMTRSQPEGLSRAIDNALQDSNIESQDISYINAHGTGTQANDTNEIESIKLSFPNAGGISVSSTKAATGHLQGTAGSIEAVVSALAVEKDLIPYTVNLEEPEPDLGVDLVMNSPRRAEVNAVLSNSMGFGGVNSAIIMSKLKDTHQKNRTLSSASDLSGKRLVISGVAAITPSGAGKEGLLAVLEKGSTCHGKIDEASIIDEQECIKYKLDRVSALVLNACRQALGDAGFDLVNDSKENVGIVLESFFGSQCTTEFLLNTIINHGPRKIDPNDVPKNTFNAASTFASLILGLKGPNATFSNAYGAGASSLEYAINLLSSGKAHMMLCGGYEGLSQLFFEVNPVYQELPYLASRDSGQKQLPVSEGIGIVVLETLENAQKRGARIYAEVLGSTAKGFQGLEKVKLREVMNKTMDEVILKSGIKAEDINCVFTNNTLIKAVDESESSILADNYKNAAAVGMKEYMGHALGAASYLELAGAALSLESMKMPSIAGHLNGISPVTGAGDRRNDAVDCVMLNTFELGGNISSTILKAY